ncbi:MAG: hypothetical protein U0Q16_04115 [Bryobacteraceae bacterium]
MTLTIDDADLPAVLPAGPMTDEEYLDLCNENEHLWFEMSAAGELIVSLPNTPLMGMRNSIITCELGL